MTFFNAKNAPAPAPTRTQGPPRGTSGRSSSDRLGQLESKFRTLEGRVDGHDSKFSDYDAWQDEAQKRVNKLETVAGGTAQRTCPGCQELRADGPEIFPGYSEPAATSAESEYHAWRQLCVVCRDGKRAPSGR